MKEAAAAASFFAVFGELGIKVGKLGVFGPKLGIKRVKLGVFYFRHRLQFIFKIILGREHVNKNWWT
ncbi:hypothetical protein DP120_09335 [Planococcus halotolerans]|uniref:Uncharacterized protein n=1 Tax=Planococcus halotolerans TaxID=2233542 RepID=A0A365KWW8_9BACL|nr:hypothetical protein DP120_09335 [Planococcus halotolerans]